MPIRILTVDDHPALRAGIIAMLESEPELQVVAEAADATHALHAFRRCLPDVTLMDLQLPGISGIEAIQVLRAEHPDARVIVLTTYRGDANARAALAAGAAGYLLKTALRSDLVAAIRQVAGGGRYICPEISTELALRLGQEPLTRREAVILQRLSEGLGNRDIARELAISVETVKAHLTHVFAKLGARTRTEAMAIAARRGLLSLVPDGLSPPLSG